MSVFLVIENEFDNSLLSTLMNSNPSWSIEYSQERQESGTCPLILDDPISEFYNHLN